jgi:hypothetical protein
MSQPERPLLDVERSILAKERATLIDRLRHVETLLGSPSSLKTKQERERERYAAERWGQRGCVAEE